MFKKIFATTLIVLILAVSGWFTYQKFFNEFSFLQKDVVEIVFAENIFSYSPYTFIESNNQRLRLIYEPLVQIDKDLAIVPALANSFGRIDDLTWEFSLNPAAKFHDGTPVRAEVVEQNFINYKLMPELKSLVSNIESVTVVNNLTIQIKTKFPDATLLNKIAQLYIAPNQPLEELEKEPNGTGPYMVKRIQKNKLSLAQNPNYYGRPAVFPKIVLTTVTDQFERIAYAANTERVIMVYPVAAGFSAQLGDAKYNLINFPTNSVSFFLFNLNRPKFNSVELRKFFNQIISDQLLVSLTDQLGVPTNQYVSKGVFGHNPDINIPKIEQVKLLNQVKTRDLVGFEFTVALPIGLETFKTVLEKTFNSVGILPRIDLIEPSEMLSTQTMQNYDLLFLGWKSDYGDATSLFENLVITGAGLNSFGYSNSRVDTLITQAQKTTNQDERLNLLRQAMQIISVENPIGIPLFESETIYAVDKRYEYLPRVDGYVDPNNLRIRLQ
jgi:peptide/nickel transport system substrate-binding protein